MTTTLKNARSTSPRTFEVIQKTLASHKVKQIVLDYDSKGRVRTIEFSIDINGEPYPFRLPARVENVEKLLYGSYPSPAQKEQAYRTAWANIRDWIAAQLALIDTGMVKPEEVFLPYLVSKQGHTLYEEMAQSQFLLPSPE